jgi:hypothetical protein
MTGAQRKQLFDFVQREARLLPDGRSVPSLRFAANKGEARDETGAGVLWAPVIGLRGSGKNLEQRTRHHGGGTSTA